MIVLDASHLVGYFKATDEHHRAALEVLSAHAGEDLAVSSITLAEFLVGPTRVGKLDTALASLTALGITASPLPDDAAIRLARIRAEAGAPRLPDCCVLLAAQVAAAAGADVTVATFDAQLRAAAKRSGFAVVPVDD